MTTQVVDIPSSIALILPFIVAVLSSILKDDKLPAWANALIAFFAVLLTSIACEYLTGGFSNNSSLIIVTGILAYVVFLLRNDYQVLLQFLYVKNSPVAPSVPAASSPAAQALLQSFNAVGPVQMAATPASPLVAIHMTPATTSVTSTPVVTPAPTPVVVPTTAQQTPEQPQEPVGELPALESLNITATQIPVVKAPAQQ